MNDDLISRKALLEKECCGRISGDDVRKAPAVDAEPVVRCKDCIHRDSSNCPMYFEDEGWCEHCGGGFPAADRTEDDGFCHLGKYFKE